MYEYDQAAWHATDAAQATHPPEQSLGRYIARQTGTGWTVVFGHLNGAHDKFLIAYEATQVTTGKEFRVEKIDPLQQDTSFYLAAAKAIDTALRDFQGERRPYNVAVLPAASDQLYVYVMPAQTRPDIYPIGGDTRYLISGNGDNIVEKRQMHKTILESDPQSTPKDATTVAGFHTHVLSDVPEDTEVFHVLTQEPPRPEYVGTLDKKIYIVNVDGTIYATKR